ncbi:MAG: M23 family metallopeptidase [bacterium]
MFIQTLAALMLAAPPATPETAKLKLAPECFAWSPRENCDPKHSLIFPVLFRSRLKDYELMQFVGSRYGKRCNPVESKPGKCLDDFHMGLDIKVPRGTPVASVRGNGRVIEITPINYCLLIEYAWEEPLAKMTQRAKYCHLDKIYPKVGDRIEKAGTAIGEVGDRGHAKGVHLHFELSVPRGQPVSEWEEETCVPDVPAKILAIPYKEVRFPTIDPSCYSYRVGYRNQ